MSFSILIVDDSDVVRHSLRSSIEQSTDWEVCGEAENGKIAIEKVRELGPDAVILDFAMPVMNGMDAARRITRIAPQTTIVMLTMHHSVELLKKAQAAGIKDVISKSGRVLDELVISLRAARAGA